MTPDTPIATDVICRSLSIPNDLAFYGAVGGALSELGYEYNWEQFGSATPAECAALMRDMIASYYNPLACETVPAPYYDTPESADDEAPAEDQHWYGEDTEIGFVEQIGIWVIAGFIAYAGQIGGAISFLTFAPKFVLAWKTSGVGGAIRVFIDGVDQGLIDTYDPAGGIIEQTYTAPGVGETHTVYQVLESVPVGNPEYNPADIDTAPMQVIRKRLTEAEAMVITDLRQQAGSGQLEMERGGAWETVPTAHNVRVDGTVAMTDRLNVNGVSDRSAFVRDNTVNNAVREVIAMRRIGGTSPAINYGGQFSMEAQHPTLGIPALARFRWYFGAVGANWRSQVQLTVGDPTTQRTVLQMSADGSVGMIGFLGAAAIIRPTVTGERDANPALASLITALTNLGLIADSTTLGTAPLDGAPGADGADGADGAPGEPGAPGSPGGTPPDTVENVGSIPNGECVDYDLVLEGNGQIVLPIVLQAGYTVEISALEGAASDGAMDVTVPFPIELFPDWYCPNGQQYILGGCGAASPFVGTDPLTSARHMVLLASVNGALFDCSAEPTLEVGAGVNDVLVVFQLNDSDLTDNQGQVRFHVQVCNPEGACVTYHDSMPTALGALTHIPRIDPANIFDLHYPDANPTGAYNSGTLATRTGYIASEFITSQNYAALLVDLEDMCLVESFSCDYHTTTDPLGAGTTVWWGAYDEGMDLITSDQFATGSDTGWKTMSRLNFDTEARYFLFAIASPTVTVALRDAHIEI